MCYSGGDGVALDPKDFGAGGDDSGGDAPPFGKYVVTGLAVWW